MVQKSLIFYILSVFNGNQLEMLCVSQFLSRKDIMFIIS